MSFSDLLRNCSLLIWGVTINVQRKGMAEPPEQEKAAPHVLGSRHYINPTSNLCPHCSLFFELYSSALIRQSYTEIPQQHIKTAPCFIPQDNAEHQANSTEAKGIALGCSVTRWTCRSSWRSPSPLTRWHQLCPYTHMCKYLKSTLQGLKERKSRHTNSLKPLKVL